MKKTAKIFIIIGMIFNCWLIFPVIVGVFALNKIDEAKTKEELKTFGIVTLLFCNLIGGICMLKISERELKGNSEKEVLTGKENLGSFKTYDYERANKLGMYLLCFSIVVCCVFGIILATHRNGEQNVPAILSVFQILFLAAIFYMFLQEKAYINKIQLILLLWCVALSIALIVLSIWTYDIHYYKFYECWVVFGLSVFSLIDGILLIINRQLQLKASKI